MVWNQRRKDWRISPVFVSTETFTNTEKGLTLSLPIVPQSSCRPSTPLCLLAKYTPACTHLSNFPWPSEFPSLFNCFSRSSVSSVLFTEENYQRLLVKKVFSFSLKKMYLLWNTRSVLEQKLTVQRHPHVIVVPRASPQSAQKHHFHSNTTLISLKKHHVTKQTLSSLFLHQNFWEHFK